MQRDPNVSIITVSDDDESCVEGGPDHSNGSRYAKAVAVTPGTSRRISVNVVPDTPELPSPSVLLGRGTRSTSNVREEEEEERVSLPPTPFLQLHTSSLLFSPRQGSSPPTKSPPRVSGSPLMELPSSPLVYYSVDSDSDGRGWKDPDTADGGGCFLGSAVPGSDSQSFRLSSPETDFFAHRPRPAADAGVGYSDSVETEYLSSSSSSSLSSLREILGLNDAGDGAELRLELASDPPVQTHVRPATTGSIAQRQLRTSPPPPLPRQSSPPFHLSNSSALLPSTTSGVRRPRKRDKRNREQVERERQFAKDLHSVNKKRMEAKDVAGDVTVVVDRRIAELDSGGSSRRQARAGVQRSASAAAGSPVPQTVSRQHRSMTADADAGADAGAGGGVLDWLRQDGIDCRVEESRDAAWSVRWEIRDRRKWDPAIRLYVPVGAHRVAARKVKTAAMVVLQSARFLDLVATGRLRRVAEVWRAAMAVARLLVVVVGLRRALRSAAAADTREFGRQMRCLLGGSGNPAPLPGAGDPAPVSAEAVDQALVELQIACPWIAWLTQCADAQALGKLLHRTTIDVALHEIAHRAGGDCDDNGIAEERDGGRRLGSGSGSGSCFVTDEVAESLRVATVRTGSGLRESWALALAQIPRVTAAAAQAIAAAYPTPRSLFAAWDAIPPSAAAARERLLASIVVPGAAAAGRRLGDAMAARIYRVLNEPDAATPLVEL
ncbi:hypothetical protein LPJ72_004320 [Coemansia sp. Benny D160-2]|nr:hypothetical protein LPJ72_004320 [Coemansia sp. Benny D160-2]